MTDPLDPDVCAARLGALAASERLRIVRLLDFPVRADARLVAGRRGTACSGMVWLLVGYHGTATHRASSEYKFHNVSKSTHPQ